MTSATVRQWLVENTPLEPTLLEGPGFAALVGERVAAVARGDESAYVEALRRSPEEVDRLTADIAVPETWLFRYPRSFELLVDWLRRRTASGAGSLRMCSIGCATGQEPCCMAMAAVHAGWAREQVAVDALDRNAEALRAGAEGRYGPASIRGEIPAWAAPFLEREGETICIDAGIRRMVRFLRTDVLASGLEALGPYDVIFCRNVMIYLNAGARARMLRSVRDSLVIGGLLFVGHAEQFIRGESALRPLAPPHTFAMERVQRQPPVEPAAAPVLAVESRPRRIARPPPSGPARAPRPAEPDPEVTLDSARELADAGRTAESETMIRSIVARRGPSAPALELLGMIRIAANDTAGARRLFEQAVYLEPTRAASLLQLALISERAGDPRRASVLWDRARRASAGREQPP